VTVQPKAPKFRSLSVFFPAYNDAPSLPGLLRKTFETLESHVEDYEVIVVNDGSRDNTAEVLDELRRPYAPHMRVITHPENRGYGGALRSGLGAAKKEFVFYTDGDGQYDVGELPLLLALAGPSTGLVNGYKLQRQDPLHRIWIGSTYNFCARLLFRIRIRDIDCDYRLIRRTLLDKLELTSTSGTICVELVRKLELSGCEVKEVGVHHYPRLHGRSQFFRVQSLAVTFFQLLRLWVRLVVLR
jgi:glycosyltransferase involved in cell wall biosynthesis